MIIFINGSINSGKSTLAKILHERIANSALLEIDLFQACVERWLTLDDAKLLNFQNAISVITNFIAHKLNVIVPYPLSRKNYDYFAASLKDLNQQIYVFTLNSRIETILDGRGDRILTDGEKERIRYHYQIGINQPDFGEIIDNTNQNPEETAEVVLNMLHFKNR